MQQGIVDCGGGVVVQHMLCMLARRSALRRAIVCSEQD